MNGAVLTRSSLQKADLVAWDAAFVRNGRMYILAANRLGSSSWDVAACPLLRRAASEGDGRHVARARLIVIGDRDLRARLLREEERGDRRG